MVLRRPVLRQVPERHLRQHDRFLARHARIGQELVARALEDVESEGGDRAEMAALDHDRPLVEHLGRLDHLAPGGEQRRVGEAALHEIEADQAVVDAGEGRALEVDDVDLDPLRIEPVHEGADQLRRRRVRVKRAVHQVDAENPERTLLAGRLAVEQPRVQQDLRRLRARLGLEAHAEPGVALPRPRIAGGRHRIGEDEERGFVASPRGELLPSLRYSWSSIARRRSRLT